MRVCLLHRDRDLDLAADLPPPTSPARSMAEHLRVDLALDTLVAAMAAGDQYLAEVARRVLLVGLTDPAAVSYRQAVLADCLSHPQPVRELYQIAVDALATRRKVHTWYFRDRPETSLAWAVQMLQLLAGNLRQLRELADAHAHRFSSEGFTRLFAELADQLDDAYLATVEAHLEQLRLRRGVLLSAGLGPGNRRAELALHRLPAPRWRDRLTSRPPGTYSFQIPDRDEAGHEALAELRNQGVAAVAEALSGAVEHVLGYFAALRAELGFYLGCLNLHARLTQLGLPTCLPEPLPVEPPTAEPPTAGPPTVAAQGLYEPCLALHLDAAVVGNDLDASATALVLVTGANQGGKSTFLRSIGVAQLMLRAGMFVPARTYRASLPTAVFTHFTREEDPSMTRGKLDEELARMSRIVDRLTPGAMLLCNESFGSTNEQEGSEIARALLDALTEAGVTVYYVTHLYELADSLHRRPASAALFLRAQRHPDGTRSFRIVPGAPEPTSHGEDSYRRILGTAAQPDRRSPVIPAQSRWPAPQAGR